MLGGHMVVVTVLMVGWTWGADQPQLAETCRVYHLDGHSGSPPPNESPKVPLRPNQPVSLSLWVKQEEDWPGEMMIIFTQFVTQLYVNEEDVCLATESGKGTRLLDLTTPTVHAHSWVTLVLALHAHTLVLYRSDQQHRAVSHRVIPKQEEEEEERHVYVTTNQVLHFAFNCATGCLIHDSASPLIDFSVLLHPPFTLYLLPQHSKHTHAQPAFTLTSHSTPPKLITLDSSDWREGEWNAVNVVVGGQQGGESGEAKRGVVQVENTTFSVTRVEGLEWTIQCHPLHPSLYPVPEESPTPRTADDNSTTRPSGGGGGGRDGDRDAEDDEETGAAGVGEIVAWLLTGLAFFLVLVLALALCTRMRPDNEAFHEGQNADYLASVGYLSHPREGSRELDEESEPSPPSSPNTLAPPSIKMI